MKELLGTKKVEGFSLGANEVLRYKDKLCIPQDQEVKKFMLEERHNTRLSIHLGTTKMYEDLKKMLWWLGMNREIDECNNMFSLLEGKGRTSKAQRVVEVTKGPMCAHFLLVNIKYSLEKLTQIYLKEMVMLHGVSSDIVSNWDPRFTSHFWQSLHRALGTRLKLSSAYHPQADGQSDKTI
ncbi:putative protein K02A2.6, partial [Mucuna pruriens]